MTELVCDMTDCGVMYHKLVCEMTKGLVCEMTKGLVCEMTDVMVCEMTNKTDSCWCVK
jgi:hypothetical protein